MKKFVLFSIVFSVAMVCTLVALVAVRSYFQYSSRQSSEGGHSLPQDLRETKHGRFTVRSNVQEADISSMLASLDPIRRNLEALVGVNRLAFDQEITVYYFKTIEEYREGFKSVVGMKLGGDYGMATYIPPQVFGSLQVGSGTICHEYVHVLIYNDFSKGLPGWLNESLAVTYGCPLVTLITNDKRTLIKDFHLYIAVRAVKLNKWTSLQDTIYQKDSKYGNNERTEILFQNGSTYIGPLATGRIFVRWMAESGRLPRFYQTFRDSLDVDKALRSAFGDDKELNAIEKDFRFWISSHQEESLIVNDTPPGTGPQSAPRASPVSD